jgi:hypothetical protein
MDFNVNTRKQRYIDFYDDVNKTNKVRKNNNIEDIIHIFSLIKIAQGAEGTIYISRTPNVKHVIVKDIDLKAIFQKKGLNKIVLDKDPLQIYDLFYSMKRNVSMPSLIETIMFTLTNQLVFQNICPHFALNYYWEYTSNKLIYYNEYANYSTLFHWGSVHRPHEEWMNLLFQIIISIISMQKYFNIIHGDLHSLNILIYKVQKGGFWKYTIDGKEYILPNMGYVVLITDFGFAYISGKVYIKWYYEDHIKDISKKERIFYDFNYLCNDLIKQKQDIKNILKETMKKTIKNTKYTLTDLLSDYYSPPEILPDEYIDSYNLDTPLNTQLLPLNFRHLSTF